MAPDVSVVVIASEPGPDASAVVTLPRPACPCRLVVAVNGALAEQAVRAEHHVLSRRVSLEPRTRRSVPRASERRPKRGPTSEQPGFFALRRDTIAAFEWRYLTELVMRHRGNVLEAAVESGVPRGTLYRMLRAHGIRPASFRD